MRTGIIVDHLLPSLHTDAGRFLTDVESANIAAKMTGDNMEQVDKLIDILVLKENTDFDYFCSILENERHQAWSG